MPDIEDSVTVYDGKFIRRTTRDLAQTGLLAGTMQIFDEHGVWVPGKTLKRRSEFPFVSAATPHPTLTVLIPNTGKKETQVTCTGTNFSEGSVIKFGTIVLTTDFISSTTVVAFIPKSMTNGAKSVTVVNPDGDVSTPALTYTVTA